MNPLLFAIFSFLFSPSNQEKCDNNSCFPHPFDLNETLIFASKLKSSSDDFLKESLLHAVKETLGKMEGLPKKIENKIKDDRFLMEKIEKVIEYNNTNKNVNESEPVQDHKTGNFRYSPYGGEAHINNWHDLYHYFPHLGTKIRLWKLEFKESAMTNSKQFKGCANPAHMVDWLVPDIDDIKKKNKIKKRN